MSMTHSTPVPRRVLLCGAALGLAGLALRPRRLPANDTTQNEITRSGEAIHQERQFKAPCARVYRALTDSAQFEKLTQLSGVMHGAAMAQMRSPTAISTEPGGAFTLFGGYIVGRQLELAPAERMVQAWRAHSWPAGVYSIARFALGGTGDTTLLVFDHEAFPHGEAGHLAAGWQEHYWGPLAQYLA
ncbi:MAG TPA: SRPBCC domain-containing protein [Steroidobacteraceae bacterium]|jgi:activator of HSP90 ATPase|nr:SRPBCC domain-containing protein [Steroidobacteraceae bacterium]